MPTPVILRRYHTFVERHAPATVTGEMRPRLRGDDKIVEDVIPGQP